MVLYFALLLSFLGLPILQWHTLLDTRRSFTAPEVFSFMMNYQRERYARDEDNDN